jgi:hypothetical protein
MDTSAQTGGAHRPLRRKHRPRASSRNARRAAEHHVAEQSRGQRRAPESGRWRTPRRSWRVGRSCTGWRHACSTRSSRARARPGRMSRRSTGPGARRLGGVSTHQTRRSRSRQPLPRSSVPGRSGRRARDRGRRRARPAWRSSAWWLRQQRALAVRRRVRRDVEQGRTASWAAQQCARLRARLS